MRYLTPREYYNHKITLATCLGELIQRNIVPEHPSCESCHQTLRFISSKVEPERVAFYCQGCKKIVNLKQYSFYKDTSMSLFDIVVLAEADLHNRIEENFLKSNIQKQKLVFPSLERASNYEFNLSELAKPKFTNEIEYESFKEQRNEVQAIEEELAYQLARKKILKSQEANEEYAVVRKQLSEHYIPNHNELKYEIKVPITAKEEERLQFADQKNPPVGQYDLRNAVQRPRSCLLINRNEKIEPIPYESSDVPYYLAHPELEERLFQINKREQNECSYQEHIQVAPTSYLPIYRAEDKKERAKTIIFNSYERFKPLEKPNYEEFVSPVSYNGNWKALKKRENASVVNSDRWQNKMTVGELITSVRD